VAAGAVGKKGDGLSRWTGYLIKPVLLGLACLALYLWVSTLELDSIEQRSAVPIMLAGIRTALVITVGTATLATFIGAGGLGALIETGITLNRTPVLITGAALTAVLALFIDWLAGVAEDVLRPRGLQ
jgi:ABC-type proline/glycine betaine transport system permease subunit